MEGIVIMQWNAQTLKRKMAELAKYIMENNIQIACICETRVLENYKLPKRLSNYNMIVSSRKGREGGGVAIIFNNQNLILEEVDRFQNEKIE